MSEKPPVGAVLVTHGRLGHELLEAARNIAADVPHLRAVSVAWEGTAEDASTGVAEAIADVDQGRGVVILTDMFGGTPSNLALTFLRPGQCEVITGVNLPMVVKLAVQTQGEDFTTLCEAVRDQGKRQIEIAGAFLAP